MNLEENEYTITSLIDYLSNNFKTKISKKRFNNSDICQYCMRGYLPYRYGGNKLTFRYEAGVKIITLGDSEILIKRKKIKNDETA